MDTSTIFDGTYRERWKQIPWRFVSLLEGILQVAIARFLKHQQSGIHLEGSVTKKSTYSNIQTFTMNIQPETTTTTNHWHRLTSSHFLNKKTQGCFNCTPGSWAKNPSVVRLMQVCGSDEDGDVMLLCDHCDEGCSFGDGYNSRTGTAMVLLVFFFFWGGGGGGGGGG